MCIFDMYGQVECIEMQDTIEERMKEKSSSYQCCFMFQFQMVSKRLPIALEQIYLWTIETNKSNSKFRSSIKFLSHLTYTAKLFEGFQIFCSLVTVKQRNWFQKMQQGTEQLLLVNWNAFYKTKKNAIQSWNLKNVHYVKSE